MKQQQPLLVNSLQNFPACQTAPLKLAPHQPVNPPNVVGYATQGQNTVGPMNVNQVISLAPCPIKAPTTTQVVQGFLGTKVLGSCQFNNFSGYSCHYSSHCTSLSLTSEFTCRSSGQCATICSTSRENMTTAEGNGALCLIPLNFNLPRRKRISRAFIT